jgi:hypothetical protein
MVIKFSDSNTNIKPFVFLNLCFIIHLIKNIWMNFYVYIYKHVYMCTHLNLCIYVYMYIFVQIFIYTLNCFDITSHMLLRLTWNLICKTGWLPTPPSPASQVLELQKVCDTTPCWLFLLKHSINISAYLCTADIFFTKVSNLFLGHLTSQVTMILF